MTKTNLKSDAVRRAAEKWVDEFSSVPGSVIEKLVKYDEAVSYYDSDSFRLIGSPRIECLGCDSSYEGDLTLDELRKDHEENGGVPCTNCNCNKGDEWAMGRPEYAFPCGWGTLFAPTDSADLWWFPKCAEEVAKLGFYVFESEDWGILLGIDAGGFDFYETFWMPLYNLRGLKWHELN